MTENIECDTVMNRICPGAGIGCILCQFFSEGTCNNVCTVKSTICNAAIMRCLWDKKDGWKYEYHGLHKSLLIYAEVCK